jgi:hypothetical protein
MRRKHKNDSKTLGQVAYDSSPKDGGKANWGRWEDAPQCVRTVHERLAKAVIKEAFRRASKP